MNEVRYTFPDIPGGIFNWSEPATGTILSGQGTHQITVQWDCEPSVIELELESECGINNFEFMTEFEEIGIAGPTEAYQNEEGLLFVAPDLVNSEYSWTLPGNAEIIGISEGITY